MLTSIAGEEKGLSVLTRCIAKSEYLLQYLLLLSHQ